MSNTDTLIKQTQEQGKSEKLEHKCYLCGYKIPEKEVIPDEPYDICNQCEASYL